MIPRIVFSLLFVLFLLLSNPGGAEPPQPVPQSSPDIEILFDAWGIPHIYAGTDADAFYGLGYISAQQRGFQMYSQLRAVQGRWAELVGDLPSTDGMDSTLAQDRRMRILGFHRTAQALAPRLNPESLGLLQAYADGVNVYFSKNAARIHPFFARYQLTPEPWTPADSIALWWYLGQRIPPDGLQDILTEFPAPPVQSSSKTTRGRTTPSPTPKPHPSDESSAVVRQEDVTSDWLGSLRDFLQLHKLPVPIHQSKGTTPKFSHAWIIGQSKSQDGGAVLCCNPRLPVLNPSLFYEFHIVGKTIDARGIGIPGFPALFNGWNKSVAWGTTALGVDQADLLLLQTDPHAPNNYRFNGNVQTMNVWEETILVKDATPETIILKETHLGPVVNDLVREVSPGLAVVSHRVPLCDPNPEMVTAFLSMMRARDTLEFSNALEHWQYPALNFIYGDANGNIGYWMAGDIPIPARANSAITPAGPIASTTEDLWVGYIPFNLLPHVLNPKRGYIISANQRPVESFYPFDLGINLPSLGDTERSWRLAERLESKPQFSAEEILEFHFESVNPIKREFLRMAFYLHDIQNVEFSEPARNALTYLKPWYKDGSHSSLENPGGELALLLNPSFTPAETELLAQYGSAISGMCSYLKSTRAILRSDSIPKFSNQEIQFVDRTLASAWQDAVDLYGEDSNQWPVTAQSVHSQHLLGYFETIEKFPSLDPQWDITVSDLSFLDNGAVHNQRSSSYLQWVPLDSVDHALSILPVSPMEQRDDRYYAVNLEAWSQNELHPAPLSREAVEKYSARSLRLRRQSQPIPSNQETTPNP